MPKRTTPKAAAFFDLDRTLLSDSAGLLAVEALTEIGLLSPRDKMIAGITRRAYRVVGETWLGMQATRRSVQRLTGWSLADLKLAAQRSVALIDRSVYAEARALIERHRGENKLICIATSTAREIVEPLAECLEVDHVIASEYEHEEGKLTGRYIGRWLWGPDKAEAVKAFAEREGIDLGASVAYSDSFYDRPLLELVGHPRAVNPDPLLRGLALRKGWPVLRFRNSPDGPRRALEPYYVLLALAQPWMFPFDLHVEGLENIPEHGGCILACNHRSYLDPVVLAAVAGKRKRKLRYLGKREVFDAPVLGDVARALGQIPVDRGTADRYPVREAVDALASGESIGIFPQGTIPRGEKFFDPVLYGKTGVARLAVASDAPVVPVALWDTERIWPRNSKVPDPVGMLTRRRVNVAVGRPEFLKAPAGKEDDKTTMEELTAGVMERIAELLPHDVRYPPKPTSEQIAKASP
jgi:putative phosphoserine phosphatase/1-acylglycerol-3-phosphate O-acyltransferase